MFKLEKERKKNLTKHNGKQDFSQDNHIPKPSIGTLHVILEWICYFYTMLAATTQQTAVLTSEQCAFAPPLVTDTEFLNRII